MGGKNVRVNFKYTAPQIIYLVNNMKANTKIIIAVVLVVIIVAASSYALYSMWAPKEEKKAAPVSLKGSCSAPPATSYTRMAVFVDFFKSHLPEGSTGETVIGAGYVAQVEQVNAGKSDFCIVPSTTISWAWEGTGAFAGKKMMNIRAAAGGMELSYVTIYLRKPVPVNSLEEIKEKKFPIRLGTQGKGSEGAFVTEVILAHYGMSIKDIEGWGGKVLFLEWADIVSNIRDELIDMVIGVSPLQSSYQLEAAQARELKYISPGKSFIEKQTAGTSPWVEGAIPKGTWKGVDTDIPTIASSLALIVRADMPNDLAYSLVKIMNDNLKELVVKWKPMGDFKMEKAYKTPIQLHPGAAAYYKEKGWMS